MMWLLVLMATVILPSSSSSHPASAASSIILRRQQASSSLPTTIINSTLATSPNNNNNMIRFDHDLGGIPFDASPGTCRHNRERLSAALQGWSDDNDGTRGATIGLWFPPNITFYLYNGVRAYGLRHVVLQIDGELRFRRDAIGVTNTTSLPPDPRFDNPHNHVPACVACRNCSHITIRSSSLQQRGIIHGGGPEWWGIPFIGYAQRLENRPYLFLFNDTTALRIHDVVFQDAPFYNLQLTNVQDVEIYRISIVSRRTTALTHTAWDLSAFNTDGIDVAGRDVHVHDVDIWTQDDCIAIKDNLWSPERISQNITVERIAASGLGLTIGSISGTTVRNVVFRDSYLHRTFKGIYMKFRMPSAHLQDGGPGLVENIYYQNITMMEPIQWPIWIGPAQQTGGNTANLCHASPCSLCWPTLAFQTCGTPPNTTYRNITLRDVTIHNPQGSPGVLLGDEVMPSIQALTFDNVKVVNTKGSSSGSDKAATKGRNDGPSDDNLYNLFPSLKYPVQDSLAQRTIFAFHVTIFFLIVSSTLWLIRVVGRQWHKRQSNGDGGDQQGNDAHFSRTQQQQQQHKKPNSCHIMTWLAMATLAIILLSIQLVYTFFTTPNIQSPQHYFVCRGVQNGIALGDTYPIPSCFEDRTGRQTSGSEAFFSYWPIFWQQFIIAMMLAIGWILYLVSARKSWIKFRHQRRRQQQSLLEGDERSSSGSRADEHDDEHPSNAPSMEGDSEPSTHSDVDDRSHLPPPESVWSSLWKTVEMNFGEQHESSSPDNNNERMETS